MKPLLKLFGDVMEKNRELAVEILGMYVHPVSSCLVCVVDSYLHCLVSFRFLKIKPNIDAPLAYIVPAINTRLGTP
jgi:hypothetical protein